MERSQLNEIYKKLDQKAREISKLLNSTFGYHNGHYCKTASGNYEKDYFPIPVISLQDLCDIEVGLEQISVTTKLTREKALSYNFEKLGSYTFEAYGVDNYLDDFYLSGSTITEMKEKIKQSKEENVFFSFYFSFDVPASQIRELVDFIRSEGFFY